MTEEVLAGIVARALKDRAFREGLAASPERTLANAGFAVTTDQLNAIALARPAEWGGQTTEDITRRIDSLYKKR